jgi:hypothetical protein
MNKKLSLKNAAAFNTADYTLGYRKHERITHRSCPDRSRGNKTPPGTGRCFATKRVSGRTYASNTYIIAGIAKKVTKVIRHDLDKSKEYTEHY